MAEFFLIFIYLVLFFFLEKDYFSCSRYICLFCFLFERGYPQNYLFDSENSFANRKLRYTCGYIQLLIKFRLRKIIHTGSRAKAILYLN